MLCFISFHLIVVVTPHIILFVDERLPRFQILCLRISPKTIFSSCHIFVTCPQFVNNFSDSWTPYLSAIRKSDGQKVLIQQQNRHNGCPCVHWTTVYWLRFESKMSKCISCIQYQSLVIVKAIPVKLWKIACLFSKKSSKKFKILAT